MGICVSVDKNSDLDMKLFHQSFGSNNGKLLIPSPVKDNNNKPIFNRDRSIAQVINDQWSPSHPAVVSVSDSVAGSKEETFFDSQPWIESDCEDDFFSVNGDFTPSRGSNASGLSFSSRTSSQFTNPLFDSKPPLPKPASSPLTRKKLADLFRDSVREQPKDVAADDAPSASGSNSERTANSSPDQDYRTRKGKPPKSGHRCLPRLLTSRSFRERKRGTVPSSV